MEAVATNGVSAGEGTHVLSADNLIKTYKKRTVVKGVSLEVRQGEIVGLLGPNGAGKTTSFYMIVGMVRPTKGKVYFDDRSITTTAMYKRARLGIGYLPQEASVFRKLSVEDNIRAVLQLQKLSRKQRKERLEELLEDLHITHIRKSKGYMLSGGERRRCEIARTLAADPKFILLDEPFAGVDPIAVEDIMGIVRNLKARGIGVLITDHNVHETLSITDRAYILIDGNVFYSGTAEAISENEEVRNRYLGSGFYFWMV
jgi:lipopolysaccharide export system ATP-binding protein